MKLTSLLKTLVVGAGFVSGSLFANSIQVQGNDDGTIWAVTSDNGSFLTFCLEKTVEIEAGQPYTYTVGPKAVGGGLNSQVEVGGDTISQGTAWLYLGFLNHTLGAIDGHKLQDAIWTLEDEITDWDATNPYLLAVLAHFGTANAAEMNYWGSEVAVINPWDDSEKDIQSLLVPVPDGGTTAMLLGASLIGLAALRRRK